MRLGSNAKHRPADFHGKSWARIVDQEQVAGWDEVFASHTFHEIQMYYPMKVIRGRQYKLIWNVAHQLPYPFASDLWAAPTWKRQWEQGPDTPYGKRTVDQYIHRTQFELFDLEADPHETRNLALDEEYADLLKPPPKQNQSLSAENQRSLDHEMGLRIVSPDTSRKRSRKFRLYPA